MPEKSDLDTFEQIIFVQPAIFCSNLQKLSQSWPSQLQRDPSKPESSPVETVTVDMILADIRREERPLNIQEKNT